jgi:hypothetical protein
MGRGHDRGTDAMSEHRPFHPQPKPAPRVQERTAQRREALRAWLECCRIVDARDTFRCRCCGRKTIKTLSVCANRLEHHHLHGRNVAPERIADPSGVVSLCMACHQRVTRHEVTIQGTDANHPLSFITDT